MTTTGYTTLEHLKRSLNNGELPVMTPVAEKAKAFIDPAFVLGQGGLQEDPRRGLRCPVKGCGGYYHSLTSHWTKAHKRTIGSISSLRDALSLHPKRPLRSLTSRKVMSVMAKRGRTKRASTKGLVQNQPHVDAGVVAQKRTATRLAGAESVESRNLRGACEAQMRKKYLDLRTKLGREPSGPELGGAFTGQVQAYYGSINAFRLALGVSVVPVGKNPRHRHLEMTHDDVVEVVEAWYRAQGRLPTTTDAERNDLLPKLPPKDFVMRVFGTQSWPVAMSHVAWLLGIDDPNYSPKQREAA